MAEHLTIGGAEHLVIKANGHLSLGGDCHECLPCRECCYSTKSLVAFGWTAIYGDPPADANPAWTAAEIAALNSIRVAASGDIPFYSPSGSILQWANGDYLVILDCGADPLVWAPSAIRAVVAGTGGQGVVELTLIDGLSPAACCGGQWNGVRLLCRRATLGFPTWDAGWYPTGDAFLSVKNNLCCRAGDGSCMQIATDICVDHPDGACPDDVAMIQRSLARPVEAIPADYDVEAEARRLKAGGCCGQPSRGSELA